MQDYWVKGVWPGFCLCTSLWTPPPAGRRSALTAFTSSIPVAHGPHGPRVWSTLWSIRENSSPGVRDLPLSIWKWLPDAILKNVAVMLNMVDAEGTWPDELLQVYVTMIPKAFGGSRRQDQRPITVQDAFCRLWVKGITQCWAPFCKATAWAPQYHRFINFCYTC